MFFLVVKECVECLSHEVKKCSIIKPGARSMKMSFIITRTIATLLGLYNKLLASIFVSMIMFFYNLKSILKKMTLTFASLDCFNFFDMLVIYGFRKRIKFKIRYNLYILKYICFA